MIVGTEEALDSPRNDRRFLRNDLSFFFTEQLDLHRTPLQFSKEDGIILKK